MKKIILMGRSECGKTTLTQALKGDVIHYHKTQYINHYDVVIDTPGEYAENASLAKALALYTYEADVVGLLLSSTEPYSLYPPCVSAYTGEGIWQILNYLREPGDILPWDSEQAAERPRVVLSNKYGRLPEEGGGHPQTV